MKRIKFKKPKKCKQAGDKSKFKTIRDAEKARFRIWSHDTSADIKDLHVYLCPYGQGNDVHYHVGHKSYYQMQLAKQQQASVPA